MARHPCEGRSKAEREAFERIAINAPPRASQQTIQTLVDAGLIINAGNRMVGRDAFGPITVPVYIVPLNHHIDWCEWCAENIPDD